MIKIKDLKLPHVDKTINIEFVDGLNILRGKNGSGKTLLLDSICGISKTPTKCIEGNENIVYLSQNVYFSGRLSSKDFLKFIYRWANKKNYMESYLKFIDNSQYAVLNSNFSWNKPVGMMSGGERMLFFATVILSLERQWYVLDEPFVSIDSDGKKILLDIINKKLNDNKNIIIVTHEEFMDEYLKNLNPNYVLM